MTDKHTPEPWIIPSGEHHITSAANDEVRKYWCITTRDTGRHYPPEVSNANARRIVACINACAGFSTEDLEIAPEKSLHNLALFSKQLNEQREELLEALENMVSMMDSGDEHGHGSEWYKKAKSAIAKAKGQ